MAAEALERAATLAGVHAAFDDIEGIERIASVETKLFLLSAMGVDTSPGGLRAFIDEIEQSECDRPLPKYLVVEAGQETAVETSSCPVGFFELICPDGAVKPIRAGAFVTIPACLPGYYTLRLGDQETTVFAAPKQAPSVQDIDGTKKKWGVSAALYGLWSERSRGVGDFEDLARAAETFGKRGADFLGINPVHALTAETTEISPYSPTHRRYLNTRHIAIETVPEFALCGPAQTAWRASPASVSSRYVDYSLADDLRRTALTAMYQTLLGHSEARGRKSEFDAYLEDSGHDLQQFATYLALSEEHGPDWRTWEAGLRDAHSNQVLHYAACNANEVGFHCFLQWLARQQCDDVQRRGKLAGMSLGLYTDLAVGVIPGSAETWMHRRNFAQDVSLGAPPDMFNPDGQFWNLAPTNPLSLKRDGFTPFIETIRACLQGAGMMRIDHVIGLDRSFWVPDDRNVEGGYVAYPFHVLMAILKIEAAQAGAVIVGEDLGVVPAGFRSKLDEAGLYGCSVMNFEREECGTLRAPEEYRERSLACIGTHDTPTFMGYWKGRDIDARVSVQQLTPERAEKERSVRQSDLNVWRDLVGASVDSDKEDEDDVAKIFDRILERLATSNAALVAVQLEDVLYQEAQPNMPGTRDEYPNWRHRYSVPIDALDDEPRLKRVAEIMTRERPNRECAEDAHRYPQEELI